MAFSFSVPPLASTFLAASSAAVYANAPGAASNIRAAAIRCMDPPILEGDISCIHERQRASERASRRPHSNKLPAFSFSVGDPDNALTEVAVGTFPRGFRGLQAIRSR